jgi:hypothetical protein
MSAGPVLLLACGALARELLALCRQPGCEHVEIDCLPAELHNTPDEIPGAVREKLEAARDRYRAIFVAYADCGTGGRLDALLQQYGVERLPGAHCYAFFTGIGRFAALHEAEPGSFYLTDFLVRHFERLVIRGLALDRHPELLPDYFGNYRRVVYLAQTCSPELEDRARACAARLGLEFERVHTGLGPLARTLARSPAWPGRDAPWPS